MLTELLAHLQNTLARLENFILFENSDSSTSSGIKFLTQPIKLHLERGMHLPWNMASIVADSGRSSWRDRAR